MPAGAVEVFSRRRDGLGEGPLWCAEERALYWLDISERRLCRQGLGEATSSSWELPEYAGCLGEMALGTLAIAMGSRLQRLSLSSCAAECLCEVADWRAGMRFNDGGVDLQGRFWASTMRNNLGAQVEAEGEPVYAPGDCAEGALYRFDSDGRVHLVEKNVEIGNTLAWSPDAKHFYFGDSARGQLYRYEFDADTGRISGKRLFFELTGRGVPDGSAMDVDGCLWNARWDGGCIVRITPQGTVDRVIELPIVRPTSCAFGGAQLETLYVTSASVGLSGEQLAEFPLSGCVLAIPGLTQGLPVPALARI